jgi:hypothetical protein
MRPLRALEDLASDTGIRRQGTAPDAVRGTCAGILGVNAFVFLTSSQPNLSTARPPAGPKPICNRPDKPADLPLNGF